MTMSWYDVLGDIAAARPRFDLSTGQPLHADTRGIIGQVLAAAAAAAGTAPRLASYRDFDGTAELRESFAAMLAGYLGRPVGDGELLVVPGAQAALRYVHAAQRGRRLMFPVGLEFPGAFDPHARPPSAGPARWSDGGTIIDLPPRPGDLDWSDVGAVVISCPHSPTGRIWPAGQLHRLAAEAERHQAWLVIDETFALPVMPLQVTPVRLVDGPNIVHLWSFSKVGLAAERIGIIAARPGIISALAAELRAAAITPSHLGQLLAAALLAQPAAGAHLGVSYQDRWQRLRAAIGPLGGGPFTIAQWQGGPFMWLGWEGGSTSDTAVFRALLSRGVAVSPGSALHATGAPVPGIRIGLTGPEEDLEQIGELIRAGLHAAPREHAYG